MVAKLPKKCFDLVLEIPQRLNVKVTQGDFTPLYGLSDEQKYRTLSDLLGGHISFSALKKQRVS